MHDQTTNALLALGLGTIAAVVLLVPTAAYQYRLDGRLQRSDLVVLLSSAVYSLALWTYTLLPTPAEGTFRCQRRRLDPSQSLRLITAHGHLHTAPLLQVVLNLLLFVPMGYFLRVILKRGWVTATLVGLATSLLIETTQVTGDWHLYYCAHRTFDVDDLAVNTLGALLGSLAAARFVDLRRGALPPLPTTISAGRRLVGLVCDAVVVVLVGGAAALAYRACCVYGPGSFDRHVQLALLVGVPFVVEAVGVLAVGRTVGEQAISVRAVARSTAYGGVVRTRSLKLLVGVTPPLVLLAIGGRVAVVGLLVVAAAQVTAVLLTPDRRGLSHLVAGMDLQIAVEEEIDSDHDGLPGVSPGPSTAPR